MANITKNSVCIYGLKDIPGEDFVDELDLTEEDKKEITYPQKEGWIISLVDALTGYCQIKLDRSLDFLDQKHYNSNQEIWIKRDLELTAWKLGRKPTNEEFYHGYIGKSDSPSNSKRYRLTYTLLFPEFMKLNVNSEKKLVYMFLEKAEEIAQINYQRFGVLGLNDYNRIMYANSKKNKTPFEISKYTQIIN